MPPVLRSFVLLRAPGLCSAPVSSKALPPHLLRDVKRPFSFSAHLLKKKSLPKVPPRVSVDGQPLAQTARSPAKSASKKSTTTTSSPVSPAAKATKPAKQPATPQYMTARDTLLQQTGPIELYRSPPHRGYIICCLVSGVSLLGYASWHYYDVTMKAGEDLPAWVRYAFAGVSFGAVCLSGWCFMSPVRLIRSITLYPRLPSDKIATTVSEGVTKRLAAKPFVEPATLVLELSPMVPFRAPRRLQVLPEECSLNHRLYYPSTMVTSRAMTHAERLAVLLEAEPQAAESLGQLLTTPVRKVWRGLKIFILQTWRVFTRDGFLKVKIDGLGVYRLDISGGKALDDGQALDRFVRSTETRI